MNKGWPDVKRWLALDREHGVLARGVTLGRFDRRCLDFTNQTFGRWIRDGGLYCQVDKFGPDGKRGPVRRSKDIPFRRRGSR